MMKASLLRTLPALGITVSILLGAALAQEVGGSNLVLASTTIKANNQTLSLSATQVAAFSATELTCPASHTKGCSIRIQVSSQFSNVVKGANGQLDVSINGNLFPVSPASLVGVARGTGTAETGPASSTFDWVVLGVTAGTQVEINIDADVTSGTGTAGDRTATIQLYLD
jgi:hypothetical protein